MDELPAIFIFLLLRVAELTQCFPVTASQGVISLVYSTLLTKKVYRRCFIDLLCHVTGGHQSVQVFFCKNPGCAANVTHIFCSDNSVNFSHTHITECSGPPPPNNVCQHDGRAFVAKDTAGSCDFEGSMGYIDTEKCTDQKNICAFISATTPSPVTTEGTPKDHAKPGHIAAGVVGGLLLLIALACVIACCCIRRRNREQNQPPARDPDVNLPLREQQDPGETSEGDTHGGPGLDDGSSPQCGA
uniref:uncharacterized protein LOC117252992 isoform X1 n=1 Tax=Epinephelus lanceolatus TaxID=310571 RepID=UPI0014479EB8|nr:uncharacterized protein LOC117252992 isoform X1 [Epinephelus lanceolatus]